MSEYQYYEFAAVDQLLTEQAQSELRSRSTRATITASGFINEYHWGNLKGEPLDWVERFFDAHVYSSSWGNCRLLLRIPRDVIDAKVILDCVGTPGLSASASVPTAFEANRTAQHSILDCRSTMIPANTPDFMNRRTVRVGWQGCCLCVMNY